MKTTPLTDLEMFDLICAAYPEKAYSDNDWDAVQEFADEIEGFDAVADLLGRVVMLTMPMSSGLTGRLAHCLGTVVIEDGAAHMVAAVRRDALKGEGK